VVNGMFSAFSARDAFLWARDMARSRMVWALYQLEDERGTFTLHRSRGLVSDDYFRRYESGPDAGRLLPLSREEFEHWVREAEALYGTTDSFGNFVPGLYRRELPEMEMPGDGPIATGAGGGLPNDNVGRRCSGAPASGGEGA
ncbi:MAG: hypothetical protein K8H88_05355, partial [Sandaracinaceae bacterium]|nr:hypothetical protein [Sandaracinaceae bacterium]